MIQTSRGGVLGMKNSKGIATVTQPAGRERVGQEAGEATTHQVAGMHGLTP
jgi:hypothetical protein